MSTIGDRANLAKPLVRPGGDAAAASVARTAAERQEQERAEVEDTLASLQQLDGFHLAHGERDAMRARARAFAARAASSFAERPDSGDAKQSGKPPRQG